MDKIKKLSEEHRLKILNNRTGKKNSPEHIAALVASRVGSKHSEETKSKMSEKRKNNPMGLVFLFLLLVTVRLLNGK